LVQISLTIPGIVCVPQKMVKRQNLKINFILFFEYIKNQKHLSIIELKKPSVIAF